MLSCSSSFSERQRKLPSRKKLPRTPLAKLLQPLANRRMEIGSSRLVRCSIWITVIYWIVHREINLREIEFSKVGDL